MSDINCPNCSHVLMRTNSSACPDDSSELRGAGFVKGEAQAICPGCGKGVTVQLVIGADGEASYRVASRRSR